MQIFVKSVGGKTLTLSVSPSTSIETVRDKIRCKSSFDTEAKPTCHYSFSSRLVFGGKQLENGRSLSDYAISSYSTIDELLPLCGGAQLGKAVKGKSKRVEDEQGQSGPTDAERRLQERVQRMKENDLRRQTALKRRNELKNRMLVEQKHSRMNLLKIQNQWRKIMRLAKVQSLRKDIDVLAQGHERDVDRKDAIIQMLDRDLEEAEEQYQTALRSHFQNIDKLLRLQDSRLLTLEKSFNDELGKMRSDFQAERLNMDRQHDRERQELLDVIAAVDAEEREREAESKQEHEQMREEIRNKNLEDINVLRITLEGTIEELERHFEHAHVQYLQNTDQQTQDFKKLTRKDHDLSRDIDHKIRKIERLQAARNHWMIKIKQNAKECEERNKALEEEKDMIASHFQTLKNRMKNFRQDQKARLATLTKNARRCKAKLLEKQRLAESVLSQAEFGRKIETEQEKVLPFSELEKVSLEDQALISEQANRRKEELAEEIGLKDSEGNEISPFHPVAVDDEGNIVDEFNYLDKFHKKFNAVLLDKIAVQREKERLEKENKDLQSILKQYLDGISVNESVMDGNNSLLVVNGRVRLNRPPVKRGGHISAVEANQMVNTNRVSSEAF
eukprot:g3751.t1